MSTDDAEPVVDVTALRRERDALREQLAQVDRVIRELEKLCVHSFRDAGRSGPYEHAICERCGAEEFRL